MARELIEPNLHVALIHAPLGLLAVGTVIEFFAPLLWRRTSFRAAGRWMILLGALTLVPAAAAGLYAMADLNNPRQSEAPWVDVRATSPIQGHAWEMMKQHALFNAAGSAALLFLVVIWLGCSDKARYGLHLVFLLLLLASVGALIAGSWEGGAMVYRHGVGVSHAAAETSTQENPQKGWRAIENYIPPIELHVILAGTAIAAGLAAIGASLRAAASAKVTVGPTPELSDIGYAFTPGVRTATPYGAAQLQGMDDASMRVEVKRLPAARFWLLAVLVAIVTSLAGWWTLAAATESWQPRDLWNLVQQNVQAKEFRRVSHVLTGGGIIVLMLLMAIVARTSGRRVVVGFFSLILLVAVAAQGWIGGLMLLDTATGPVQRLNPSTMPSSEIAAPVLTPPATTRTIAPPTSAATAPVSRAL